MLCYELKKLKIDKKEDSDLLPFTFELSDAVIQKIIEKAEEINVESDLLYKCHVWDEQYSAKIFSIIKKSKL